MSHFKSGFVLDHDEKWRPASIRHVGESLEQHVRVTYHDQDKETISLPCNSKRISFSPAPEKQSLWHVQQSDMELSTFSDACPSQFCSHRGVFFDAKLMYCMTIDGKLCEHVRIHNELWVLVRGHTSSTSSSPSSSSVIKCETRTMTSDILFLHLANQSCRHVKVISNAQERIEARKAHCNNQERLSKLRLDLLQSLNSNMDALNLEIQNSGDNMDWTNLGTFAIERNQIDQELKRIDAELSKPEVLPTPEFDDLNRYCLQPRIPIVLGANMLPNGVVLHVSSGYGQETKIEFEGTPIKSGPFYVGGVLQI